MLSAIHPSHNKKCELSSTAPTPFRAKCYTPRSRSLPNVPCRGWVTQNSPFGYIGCEAAYNEGDPWRQALLEHLRGNRAVLYAFMEERLPELRIDPMEATYLAWVDVRRLG